MRSTLLATCFAAAMVSTSVYAGPLVPSGVAPGATYQLAFVTSTGTHAESGDINFYNLLVQAAADAAGIGGSEGITWSAIASTAAVDARSNALVSTQVFNLGGQLVATDYPDFWDGAHTVGVGIDYNEYSIGKNTNVWTGSNTDGTHAGINVLGNSSAVWGESSLSSDSWVKRGIQTTGVSYSLYALSEPLAAPVPEPTTWAMLLAGLALIGAMAKRREAA